MILGSIASFAGSIGSAIASSVGSIGSALSSFASSVGPVIGKVVETIKPVAGFLGQFANTFLQVLGIFKPQDRVEEIGERALQGADKGITLDRFDDFDEYLEALRGFDLDPDVSNNRNNAEKLVAGLGVGTVGVERKYNLEHGSLGGIWLLPMSNPGYFTPERMQHLVAGGRLGANVFAYLENRLGAGEARDFEKKLEVAPDGQALDEGGLGALYSALDSAQEKWAEMARQLDQRDAPGRGDA